MSENPLTVIDKEIQNIKHKLENTKCELTKAICMVQTSQEITDHLKQYIKNQTDVVQMLELILESKKNEYSWTMLAEEERG